MTTGFVINDVTGLNPIPVLGVSTPTSIGEVQQAVARTDVPISVGGGHFSMGGQTASPGSLHLDMRRMNRVLSFSPETRTIRVQAGIRWCDIQKFVDPHGLSVKIMQTYANFTVGGSLSVNVHGRYMGLGPLVLSVRSIRLVLISGALADASPTENAELFYGVIGGYGALGVIVEAELELSPNTRVARSAKPMALRDYVRFFRQRVRNSPDVLFHNADIYPPHYTRVRTVTWSVTGRPATTGTRLQWQRRRHLIEKYFFWAITETPFGKWRREHLVDPLVYATRPVHWRNYEAGYSVAELEPLSRTASTYVLQEYFVAPERLEACVADVAAILQRHRVNVINISIRHAQQDPGTLLAWARGETFALVLYYKQRTRDNARDRVGVWTRELIDAVLSHGGTYYLPYQLHATHEQFHRAYPRAHELFTLKRRLDPAYRLRNALWDKYYAPGIGIEIGHPARIGAAAGEPLRSSGSAAATASEFHQVMTETLWHDRVYAFLHNVFRLYPEDRFFLLIKEACERYADDEAIYRHVQQQLPGIKPFLGDLRLAIPALTKQKQEMKRQTLQLLGARRQFNGYVEIGSTGRYVSALRSEIRFDGATSLVNDVAPSNSPVDILERGGLRQIGSWLPLKGYQPLPEQTLPDASVDFVSCYVGLHHMTPQTLNPFIRSIARVLRPGGVFVLRDHDAGSPEMFRFVSLIHTIFNAGTGASWEQNREELRYFTSIDEWARRLRDVGLADQGARLLQPHDPSANVLMAFVREAGAG
jgi:FAD/FMN-containing dehydrogenase/SAM-dependent methyltransferase